VVKSGSTGPLSLSVSRGGGEERGEGAQHVISSRWEVVC